MIDHVQRFSPLFACEVGTTWIPKMGMTLKIAQGFGMVEGGNVAGTKLKRQLCDMCKAVTTP